MFSTKHKSFKEGLREKFQDSEDLVYKEIHTKEKDLEAFYIKTISDVKVLQELIIKPFFEIGSPKEYIAYLDSNPKIKSFESEEKTIEELIRGAALLFFQGEMFLVDNKIDPNSSTMETSVETTIQGPQTGFSESLPVNIGLIRKRYPNVTLKVESAVIGNISNTQVMFLYDTKYAKPEVIDTVKRFIKSVDINMFQSAEQLLDSIKRSNRALFPIMLTTERPDRAAINLAGGKIVLCVAGSPFVVILPTVMKDFMVSMADIYQTYWIGRFLQVLRYFAFIVSIVLPGMYVALVSYNPEVFRVQLALSIAGSRTGVPYPSFIEVLLMLFMMELLTEASIRLPKAIGPTATTVGGLILGQAATEAGLVSNIMIMIVSSVAISNFVVPINTFSFSIRIIKYYILAAATLFGLVGVVVGFFMLIAYLVRIDSFGQPFLTLVQSKPSKE